MRFLAATVGLLSFITACSDPDDPTIVSYQVFFLAVGGDTTAQRARTYDCVINASFAVPLPVEPNGTVQLPLTINRSLIDHSGDHQEFTSADTLMDDAVLAYDGLGEDNLSISLTLGPYTLAPPTGARDAGSAGYAGMWSCGPGLPLARDSALTFYGYDPNLEIPGTWQISEILPIE
jgi:hypothetical protein